MKYHWAWLVKLDSGGAIHLCNNIHQSRCSYVALLPSHSGVVPLQVPSDVHLLSFNPLRMNPSSHEKDTSWEYVVRSPRFDPLKGALSGPQSLAKRTDTFVSLMINLQNWLSQFSYVSVAYTRVRSLFLCRISLYKNKWKSTLVKSNDVSESSWRHFQVQKWFK